MVVSLAPWRRPGFGSARQPLARQAAGRWLARVGEVLLTWSERARQRRELASLDEKLLRDIGISRADAIGEAAKPFWRA
jgi:uncharacterized protein YjiS (DUF1127 family)